MIKVFFVGIGLLFGFIFVSEKALVPASLNSNYQERFADLDSVYLPKIDSTENLIQHYAYSLVYNESHEQAKWVFYKLSQELLDGPFKRKNNFKQDPLILSGSANHIDYKGSGYDRGHLAPAADMTWSELAMSESFYYSNMSPQSPSFNRGIWKKLETKVRKWARDFDSIYVTTGPILDSNLMTIGASVSIPEYYFKSIIGFKKGITTAIAFVLPNTASKAPLIDYAISVDSLEIISGINLHFNMESQIQDSLEKTLCMSCWKWD